MTQSKKNAPRSETDFLVLWKMAYARESFKYAQEICNYILENQLHRRHPLYYPFCIAIAVFYCRPFKGSNVIGFLPVEMVPDAYQFLHRPMTTFRDQVGVHTDGDSVNHSKDGLPANCVWLIIDRDGKESLRIRENKFRWPAIAKIRELLQILIKKTTFRVERRRRKLDGRASVTPGDYLMYLKNETFRKC